jgi:hypothetical protein
VQAVLERVSVVDTFNPPALAVIVTGVVFGVANVEATKVVELTPPGTFIDEGRLTSNGALSERDTKKPPDSAFLLSVMVQLLCWPLDTVDGAQDTPVRLGGVGCTIVTMPPVAVVEMAAPTVDADKPPLSWILEDVFSVDGDIVNVMVATTPFWIRFELTPHTTQAVVPLRLLQETDLPAAVAALPAAKATEEKSAPE